ncbi:Rab proteins geranylgeranyltransferase component A [Pseudozyma hubeiensis]|nr:Rab proteins geranylgeranyltransferase component A [Pseudozyma hubeiensis]
MSLDQTHYDVAIFSTGLAQSILSAALASAGLSVIHIDKNDYYADQWASLTLSELLRWTQSVNQSCRNGTLSVQHVEGVDLRFPSATDTKEAKSSEPSPLPPSLASLDRHYAISLAPTLLPATGPSIDCLIRSKVSSYATFRLLERTCVASASTDDSTNMTLTSVPASKEDIFKTKTLSLIAKRKLMKLLMYIGTEDWQSDLARDQNLARKPFVAYLAEVHKMSPDLIDAVAYGVCLCATPDETTEVAMKRAKSHMQSVGRYGNSAHLVGQYGGAGELAQGYCRASAVKGGMFILAHGIKSAKKVVDKWEIGVDGIDEVVTADYIVSSDEVLHELGLQSNGTSHSDPKHKVLYKAILVLDKPIRFTDAEKPDAQTTEEDANDASSGTAVFPDLPPETGLVVFPPGSIGGNANTVTVLMMGEGTFSCPKGQYVYYIQTEASEQDSQRSALDALQAVLAQVIRLTNEAQPSEATSATQPLLQMTYRQLIPLSPNESTHPNISSIPFPPASSAQSSTEASHATTSISGLTDAAVHLAEKVYYDVLASRLTSPQCGDSHEEKLQWIKQTLEKQKLERKRRKRRDPAEYQGRGGRGADDGVTREQDDEHPEDDGDDLKVVGFFEANLDEEDDNDDDGDAE